MRVKQQYEKAYNNVVLSAGIGCATDVYQNAPMCCLAARSPDASSAPVIFRPKDVDCRPGGQAHGTHVIVAVADYQAPTVPVYDTDEAEKGCDNLLGQSQTLCQTPQRSLAAPSRI